MNQRTCGLAVAPLLACVLCLCSPRTGGPRAGETPDPVSSAIQGIPGWTAVEPLRVIPPAQLYEEIDGGAELFLQYKFVALYVTTLRSDAGDTLALEVYRHADALSAFGPFSRENSDCPQAPAALGEACQSAKALCFVQGSLYVKVLSRSKVSVTAPASLAAALSSRLPAGGAALTEFDVFPAAGLVAHSRKYFTANYLGVKAMGPAFSVDYQADSGKATLFYVPAGRPRLADSLLLALKAVYEGGSVKAFEPGRMLQVEDPFEGHILARLSGSTIAGCVSRKGSAAHDGLVDSIIQRTAHP